MNSTQNCVRKSMIWIQSHGDFHYLQYVLHLIKLCLPWDFTCQIHWPFTSCTKNKQTKKHITINDSLFGVIHCKYIHCEFKSQLQGSYSICSRSCESQELEEQQGFSLDMSAAVCCLNRVPWCCKERAGLTCVNAFHTVPLSHPQCCHNYPQTHWAHNFTPFASLEHCQRTLNCTWPPRFDLSAMPYSRAKQK